MENEIEAIRERHEAEIREPNKWTFNRAETAHADRATLLRALDAMVEENARMKEALQAIVDNAEIGEREADTAFARAALSETGAA
jgi:hypothetical protein